MSTPTTIETRCPSSNPLVRRILGQPEKRSINGQKTPETKSLELLDPNALNIPYDLAVINPRLANVPVELNYLAQYEPNYLDKNEIEDLYQRTLKAKEELETAKKATSDKRMRSIPNDRVYEIVTNNFGLEKNPGSPYLKHPLIQEFVKNSQYGFDSMRVRALNDACKPNFALGFFQLPYNKFLKEPSLQFFAFEREDFPQLQNLYPSHASAVKLIKSTEAYANPFIDVASFPESYACDPRNKAHKNDSDSQARYHIDKFLARIYAYTNFALRYNTNPNTFNLMKNASYEDLFKAAASWLSVHEFYHSTGPVPRVKRNLIDTDDKQVEINSWYGYKIKDSRKGGAWEELRVDVNGMLEANSIAAAKGYKDLGPLVRELILAERLLRYPIQRDPEDDFDAMTSHILINWLMEYQAIRVDNNQLSIVSDDKLTEALRSLKQTIDQVEENITKGKNLSEQEDYKAGVKTICNFIDKWVCKHNGETIADYALHPFYKAMRESRKDLGKRREYLNSLWWQEIAQQCMDSLSKSIQLSNGHQRPWYYGLARESFAIDDTASSKTSQKKSSQEAASKNSESLEPDPKPIFWAYDQANDLEGRFNTVLSNLKEYPSKVEVDLAFLRHLEIEAGVHSQSAPPSPAKTLMQLAFDKDLPRELIYFAYSFDFKNRLNLNQLNAYNESIEKFYAEPLSLIKDANDKENFVSQIRRVLRARIRRDIYGDPDNKIPGDISKDEFYRKIAEREKMTRREITIATVTGLLALTLGIPTTAGVINHFNNGLEEVFITDDRAMIQPTPIIEITNSSRSSQRFIVYKDGQEFYKLDGNSINLLARILPILRKIGVPADMPDNKILFTVPGPAVKHNTILVSGDDNSKNITLSKDVLRKILNANVTDDDLERFLRTITVVK